MSMDVRQTFGLLQADFSNCGAIVRDLADRSEVMFQTAQKAQEFFNLFAIPFREDDDLKIIMGFEPALDDRTVTLAPIEGADQDEAMEAIRMYVRTIVLRERTELEEYM